MSQLTLRRVAVFAAFAVPALAFAAPPAQPDVTDVVAFILASVATITLIGNARLIVQTALGVFRWARAAIR
jgi:hypothetical protein